MLKIDKMICGYRGVALMLALLVALVAGLFSALAYAADSSNTSSSSDSSADVHLLTMEELGDAIYTKSTAEIAELVDSGWVDRGVAWKDDGAQQIPVYREYNPSNATVNNNYTTSKEEHDWVISLGWQDKGIAWYSTGDDGLPVYRVFNLNTGLHFYTASQTTRDAMIAQGWLYEGVGMYAAKVGPAASYAMPLWAGVSFGIGDIPSQTYTGSEIKPALTVKIGSNDVVEGRDYAVSYSNNVGPGTASVTVTGLGDYAFANPTTKTFVIQLARSDGGGSGGQQPGGNDAGDSSQQPKQSMHRLYNPNSGEHFYTADDAERDHLVSLGWNSEGEGWSAPATSSTPVYRMYNPNAGEHHYTPDAAERDNLIAAGWNDEGVGWYSDDAQTVPLYRDYNPNAFSNNHNYTASADEHATLAAAGWVDEGIAWYGV